MSADKARIEGEKAVIEKERSICQAQLDEALPALQKAQDAAAKITNKDLSELKGLKDPHIVMKYVVDAMAIILLQKVRCDITIVSHYATKKDREDKNEFYMMADSWDPLGKAAFLDPELLKKLKMMADEKNENLMNDEILELIEPYTRGKDNWLTEKNANNASAAIGALREWMVQIESFSINTKIIKPKRLALAQQMEKLSVAMAALEKAEAELAVIKAKCDELDTTFRKTNNEKNELEEQARRQKKQIDQANRLINGLSDERERWDKGANELSEEKRKLVGNVGLATAFISYCGPFNAEYRDLIATERLISDLRKMSVPYTASIYAE